MRSTVIEEQEEKEKITEMEMAQVMQVLHQLSPGGVHKVKTYAKTLLEIERGRLLP